MRHLKLLLFLLTCFLIFKSNAQKVSHQVTGIIRDSTGTKMTGVTVSVKGSKIATVSNEEGRFNITVPSDKANLLAELFF